MFSSGLVLEGGGLRAAYESGVTDAFIENNITFPYVIGVSAGSCNGVSFIAKNLHRMRDIMVNYAHDERYMGIKSIFKNGEYLNSKWIFGELSYEMFPLNYDEFENSKTKFCVVASNAKTGKAEYFYPTDFRKGCEIIHASCALPMVTKPVQIGKDMYYDGGICDSIPLKKAYEDGCEKCVVVLTQDRHFIKKPLGHEKAIRKALHKFPLTAEAVINRQKMYNEQRKFVFEQEKLGNVLVLAPRSPLEFHTLDSEPMKIQHIYNLGYEQTIDRIDEIKDFLSSSMSQTAYHSK